jgi:hypothetical protein
MNPDLKITAFYYLAYPDTVPEDEYEAGSETYVEIGQEGSRHADFLITVSVFVCTPKYIYSLLSNLESGSIYLRNVIIVGRFNDEIIRAALNAHFEDLKKEGMTK